MKNTTTGLRVLKTGLLMLAAGTTLSNASIIIGPGPGATAGGVPDSGGSTFVDRTVTPVVTADTYSVTNFDVRIVGAEK